MSSSEDPHANDPLPPGWSRGFSNSQKRTFYCHDETKHTQWHFPTASEAKDPSKAIERAKAHTEREKRKAAALSVPQQQQQQQSEIKRPRTDSLSDNNNILHDLDASSVAIIVPFRDLHAAQKRASHLQQFVPHMVQLLGKLCQEGKLSNYHVYIVEQSDDQRKFNRGKLLNIGFDLARKASTKKHDVFIFHDVDLLPDAELGNWYAKFPKRPIHLARVWNRYSNNPKYFGGAVSFSSSDYKRINGYPNNYWGWGGEDDEMQKRLERLGITFEAPSRGSLKDLEDMTLTEKLDFLRSNKAWKNNVKWELNDEHEKTWKTNGLADLKYSVLKTTELEDGNNHASKITVDVKLNGSHWTNDKVSVDLI